MNDNENPLAQMEQSTASQSSAAPTSGNLPQEPVLSPVEKAQKIYEQERLNLIRRQQELVAELEGRVKIQPGDYLSAIAQGFGNPQNLSFASGVAGAAGNIGSLQANEQKRIQDLAKMKLELQMQELGMRKEDIELAKNKQLSATLENLISGKASPDAASAAGIPAAQASAIAQMPQEYRAMILAQLQTGDVKGAISELNKYLLESTKKPEKVKEFEYYIGQLKSPAARSIAQQMAANNYFLGSPADRSKAILDIRKSIDEGIIPANEGNLLIQGLTSIGGDQGAPAAPSKPSAIAPSMQISPEVQAQRDRDAAEIRRREQTGEGIPTASIVPGSTAGISPRQAREVAAKGAETTAVKTAESIAAKRDALSQKAENATRIINDANSIFDLATKNPGGFGILAKPGISNALLTLVENGIRVGNFSVGLNDVQSAILKAGGTQQEIDAVAALAQIAVQTSLDLSAAVKGSVSNYEQQLFQQASFSKNDSPAVLKYKAELARARGEFDKFTWNKYRQFEKTGRGNIEDFKESPEYSNYVKQYESALSKIRNTYFR